MNKVQDKALSELIRTIGQVDFPEALSYFIGKIIKFDCCIIFAYHKDHQPEALYGDYDPMLFPAIESLYIQGYYLLDPFYHAISNGIQRDVHRLFDLAPDKFKQTRYFKEYYRDTTVMDEIAIFAHITNETTIAVSFCRHSKSNMLFSKNEQAKIKSFKDVLTAVCEQHWKYYQPKEGVNISLLPIKDRLRAKLKSQCNIMLSPRQAEVAMYILQ